MDNLLNEKVNTLRGLIPIGINGAMKYLKQTDGDIDKAIDLYKSDTFNTVRKSLDFEISENKIRKYLDETNFDIQKTKDKLFEDRFTLTERILLKEKNKENAFDKIQYSIEKNFDLKRDFWLSIDQIKKLPTPLYSFIIIQEWRNYESWEGFGSAILTEFTQYAIKEIRDVLELKEMATKLQSAMEISNHFYSIKRSILERPDIDIYEEYYQENESILIGYLYDYVKENITQFP